MITVSEILEVIMLACFGLSWPISLVKNFRAKSAKSTSLAFMCLILFGYLAGISAKAMTVGTNYVFFVYLFNIAMVIANLAVTLLNRHREQKAERKVLHTVHTRKTLPLGGEAYRAA